MIGKTILLVVMWVIIFGSRTIFYPVMTNDVALRQLNDTAESFTSFAIYNTIWNSAEIALMVICLLVFVPEIKILYKKFVEFIKS